MNEEILTFKDNKIELESQIKKLKETNIKQEEEIKIVKLHENWSNTKII